MTVLFTFLAYLLPVEPFGSLQLVYRGHMTGLLTSYGIFVVFS